MPCFQIGFKSMVKFMAILHVTSILQDHLSLFSNYYQTILKIQIVITSRFHTLPGRTECKRDSEEKKRENFKWFTH